MGFEALLRKKSNKWIENTVNPGNMKVTIVFLLIFHFFVDGEVTDYEIYDMVDTMTALTNATTFYELFEVSPSALASQISSSFRKKSLEFHPDKSSNPNAQAIFSLLSWAATLLKNPEDRSHYDWILNEAPPWHRSSQMMKRALTKKLSLLQVSIIAIGFISLVQALALWGSWAATRWRQASSKKSLESLGSKELKRLKRKVEGKEISQEIMMNSSNLSAIAESQAMPIPFPKFSELLLPKLCIHLPKFLFVGLFRLFFRIFSRKELPQVYESTTPIKGHKNKLRSSTPISRPGSPVVVSSRPFHEDSENESKLHPEYEEDGKVYMKSGPFSSEDLSLLSSLMAKIPGGTSNRWELIAERLGRSPSEVLIEAQSMRNRFKK